MTIPVELFRHRFPIRVRFNQVDRQNVVHSLWYFFYFEEARLEYIREIGLPIDDGTFITHDKFFIVRNSCEYFAPSGFDEELTILTRISFVRNSSIEFEHWAMKADGTPAARGEHVFVRVNEHSDRPERVPEDLREKIRAFEGDNVTFIAYDED